MVSVGLIKMDMESKLSLIIQLRKRFEDLERDIIADIEAIYDIEKEEK